MKLITEPKVYLLGQQEVNQDELDRFLADQGVAWESSSEVGAQVIAETSGRLCYMSFAKPRPGGNKVYLDHLKEVGHGSVLESAVFNLLITGVSRSLTHELVRHRAGTGYCLAGDTEVYSGSQQKGRYDGVKKRWTIRKLFEMSQDWRRKGRLKLLLVRCFDGEKFVPAHIKDVSESGVKDILKVTLADGKSIRCSADHRFMTPDGWKPVAELSVGDMLGTNGLPPVNIDKEWLERRYRDENTTLKEVASELECTTHTVRKWAKRYGIQKPIGQGQRGRVPPNKGTRYKTGYRHTPENRRLFGLQKRGERNPGWQGDAASPGAGRLRAQRMHPPQPCEACGKANGHRHHVDRNPINNARENIEFLCPSCHTRRHLEEDGHPNALTVRWVAIAAIEPDGQEMTYDLEVDHPAHNFVANGLVTHNSQLSQRYVDESVAEYVVPPDLQEEVAAMEYLEAWCKGYMETSGESWEAAEAAYYRHNPGTRQEAVEAGRIWRASIDVAHAQYCQLSDYLAAKAAARGLQKTEARKFARQAARSVLPNATETKIAVTVNARAARHFLEQRGSRHADPEIRVLAGKVYDVLVKAAPHLFDDYKVTLLPDGTRELTTTWPKV